MINSPNAPSEISPWIDYKEQEQTDFEQLCDYLLAKRRIDLLIDAIDLRHAHDNKDKTYAQSIMEKASSMTISNYQMLKCQMRANIGKIILNYHYNPRFNSSIDYSPHSSDQSSSHPSDHSSSHPSDHSSAHPFPHSFYTLREIHFVPFAGVNRHIFTQHDSYPDVRFFDLTAVETLFLRAMALQLFFPKKILSHNQQTNNRQTNSCTNITCSYSVATGSLKSEFGVIELTNGKIRFLTPHNDITDKNCESCINQINNLQILESISRQMGKETLNQTLNVISNQYSIQYIKTRLIFSGDTQLNLLQQQTMLGLLYLEQIIRQNISNDHSNKCPPNLAQFFMITYEIWFSDLINQVVKKSKNTVSPGYNRVDNHLQRLPMLKRAANKVAFASSVWFSTRNPNLLDRRSTSKWIFHFLRSAYFQTPTEARKMLKFTLNVIDSWLNEAEKNGSHYDVFELSFFGIVASAMKPLSQQKQNTVYWNKLQTSGKYKSDNPKEYRHNKWKISTDFPIILECFLKPRMLLEHPIVEDLFQCHFLIFDVNRITFYNLEEYINISSTSKIKDTTRSKYGLNEIKKGPVSILFRHASTSWNNYMVINDWDDLIQKSRGQVNDINDFSWLENMDISNHMGKSQNYFPTIAKQYQ